MSLHRDLREFIGLLNSHGVEFLLLGGHAVAFHGFPRFTGDIDFLVRASEENADRLVQVLEEFGFAGAAALRVGFTEPEQVVQLGRPPNRIDLLTSASGIEFEPAWQSSIASELDGLPVRYLDFATLIANKRASGRSKDLLDIAELERASKLP